MSDYLTQLSEFVSGLQFENLPPEVVERARWVVADTLAVVAAGGREEEVRQLTRRLIEQRAGGAGSATLLTSGERTDILTAALVNGSAGTFLELDEGNQFGRGHPAVHMLPALLAVAENKRLSGRDLLVSLVAGYEIGTRIGISGKIRMSMHPHGTWGTVGAAVGVGRLLGSDPAGIRELINLSSCLAFATSRKTMLEGATVRNVYSGVSNHMGILAHDLVASGFTGEADGLATVYGSVISETFDTGAMVADLGTRFEIARNYFKKHACCRYNHATLDALLAIMAAAPGEGLSAEQVERIQVETYSLAAQLCDPHPSNMLAAKFSIPFAVATTLINGHAAVRCFQPEAVADPRIQALAGKVTVTEDPALTAMMPDRRPSRVRVIRTDGTVLEAEAFLNKGDFEDPYPVKTLEEKYFDLSIPVWGEAAARRVLQAVMSLESIDDVNRITDLLTSG